jgi:hypothetical protein
MPLNPLTWLDWLRKIDRMLALEDSHGKIIRKQAEEIQELKDRMTKLETLVQAREDILVAKAEGAAAAAASAAVSQNIAGLSHGLGKLEARLDGITQGRLSRPD